MNKKLIVLILMGVLILPLVQAGFIKELVGLEYEDKISSDKLIASKNSLGKIQAEYKSIGVTKADARFNITANQNGYYEIKINMDKGTYEAINEYELKTKKLVCETHTKIIDNYKEKKEKYYNQTTGKKEERIIRENNPTTEEVTKCEYKLVPTASLLRETEEGAELVYIDYFYKDETREYYFDLNVEFRKKGEWFIEYSPLEDKSKKLKLDPVFDTTGWKNRDDYNFTTLDSEIYRNSTLCVSDFDSTKLTQPDYDDIRAVWNDSGTLYELPTTLKNAGSTNATVCFPSYTNGNPIVNQNYSIYWGHETIDAPTKWNNTRTFNVQFDNPGDTATAVLNFEGYTSLDAKYIQLEDNSSMSRTFNTTVNMTFVPNTLSGYMGNAMQTLSNPSSYSNAMWVDNQDRELGWQGGSDWVVRVCANITRGPTGGNEVIFMYPSGTTSIGGFTFYDANNPKGNITRYGSDGSAYYSFYNLTLGKWGCFQIDTTSSNNKVSFYNGTELYPVEFNDDQTVLPITDTITMLGGWAANPNADKAFVGQIDNLMFINGSTDLLPPIFYNNYPTFENSTEGITQAPQVYNVFPPNQTLTRDRANTFYYNVTGDGDIVNCTLFLNSTYIVSNQTEVVKEANNTIQITLPHYILDYDTYNWYVQCEDDGGVKANSSQWNITVADNPPNVYNVFPLNNTIVEMTQSVNFTYNFTDDGEVVNCSLYLNDLINQSNNTILVPFINNTFNFTTMAFGDWNWLIQCEDDIGQKANSSAFNITIYNDPPLVNISTPYNNSIQYTDEINVTYQPYDGHEITECKVYLNDLVNISNTSAIIEGINNTINLTGLDYGQYNITVECSDEYSYKTNSTIFNFTRFQAYPIVTGLYPPTDYLTRTRNVNFTYNVSIEGGYSINNCTIILNNTLMQLSDNTITTNTNQTLNITLPSQYQNQWNWIIQCEGSNGLKVNSSNYNLQYNNIPTIPNEVLPLNETYYTAGDIYLVCNGSEDNENNSIKYEIYTGTSLAGLTKQANSTETNSTWTVSEAGAYYWRCRANDNQESSNYTDLRVFYVLDNNTFDVTSLGCGDLSELRCWDFAFEENRSITTASFDYNIQLALGDGTSFTRYGSLGENSSFCLCANATTNTNYSIGYGELQYYKEGYTDRRYYLFSNKTVSTDNKVNDTLFLLENGDATSFLFTMQDENLDPFTNHYLNLLRWYPDLNTYDTVGMAKTDEKGQTVMRVVAEDVDYRVGLYTTTGDLIRLLAPIRFACVSTPCEYEATISEEDFDWTSLFGINSTSYYDFDTGIITYYYNDPSQATEEIVMEVSMLSGDSLTPVCFEHATGYTGVMTCNVSDYTGTANVKVYRSASDAKIIHLKNYLTGRTAFTTTTGLFINMVLFLTLTLIGIASPIVAIIFGFAGLFMGVIIGSINTVIFMGLACMGGIVIHFMKRADKNR